MTLDELKAKAALYANGKRSEDMFHQDILAYLKDATPDDYMALALWLKTQGRMQ